ncbi:lanthionine synthetase C family protein [Micromonospora sp. WMMD980]|uniref:lanthionine synthetase C family protein n=1 Tax=Micromonospora sp. WMMD980 TaxID=3016088 RepID=UPI0024170D8E|nr:lanthionine synthetase C family protein [Micromonospora sp. WMMD980]MDG4803704.1 lanthionine synthetase C family protein [Micromonospora sp. WMMD980]
MTDNQQQFLAVAEAVAAQLADPAIASALAAGRTWWPHHLAHGAPGIVLLHAELAAAGTAPWSRVQHWLAYAAGHTVTSGADSHLNYGAPALAVAMATVAEQIPGAYQTSLNVLDATIADDTLRRVAVITGRLEPGQRPLLADFDVVRGVTGVGGYLLRRRPGDPAVTAVLSYLVRLTRPVIHRGQRVPGWWTPVSPHGDRDDRYPGGHANLGVAHGIAGPLTLLALATRAGVTVPGQSEAIATICAWLDQWRTGTDTTPTWPYWITWDEHRAGRPSEPAHPRRPSWCYGTAGLARAQQLAALALHDPGRQHASEQALLFALTDPGHRAAVTDASLCHGWAGMAHIAARAATDATPATAAALRDTAARLLDVVHQPGTDPRDTAAALLAPDGGGPGLLDGAAGTALASLTAAGLTPRTRWDACLLIT